MACKSIIPSSSSPKYDVFVSFRGKDTRNGFTDYLFGSLHRERILAFRDDKNLKKGESIAPELLHAIEGSLVYIVVFSKNYGSSTWCLRELAKIVECLNNGSPTKHVLPVFYDVDPSEVRRQSGEFGKAFVKHEERFKHDLDMVQTWKGALTQVANLSGSDVRDKPQYAEIEKIVEETLHLLDPKFSSVPNDLVGWQSPVEELEELLLVESDNDNDVRVLGICGMGGIGKTTLATVLYDKISRGYDACCFIHDVSKIYRKDGSIGAQKQLLSQILKEDNLQICNYSQAANLRGRVHRKKALIVLDNVDRVAQLEILSQNPEWLGAGSKIIIISRDEHILRNYGVNVVYNVELLNHDNALQLFCRKAFKCDDFKSDYRELTYDALDYANGHPLAIKVLGSFLSCLNVVEWTSTLARLRENPERDLMDVLRISYDGLKDLEKEIFVDIACFFGEHAETYVRKILDIREFRPDIGIRVLLDKSLITRRNDKYIYMHDLFIELGRSIVREKSPKKPRKWSRLWDMEDLENVLLENKVSKNLEALVLSSEWGIISSMRADAFSQMSNLNLLKIEIVQFSGSLNYLSNKLRYLSWKYYPFTCLPSSFEPDKLVELNLSHSRIIQLWKVTKFLYKLRHMDLSYSTNLIKLLDFRKVPNLEYLNLEGCIKLQRIDPSIGLLKKLAFVNLRDCIKLVSVPINIFDISSLEFLYLDGCSNLKKFDASETSIDWPSTSSVGLLLPSLPNFLCLRHLDLSFCNLLQIPNFIGSLHYLERLNLEGNHFVTLPSIEKLSKLVSLNLMNCEQLTYLPKLPSITVLPATSKSFNYSAVVGLYMFNCPNLCDLEQCYRMAFSWMIQVIELLIQSSLPFYQFGIVIPGSQIPRWFNKQSVGNTIRLDPPPMHDNHWIGIVCCAIFGKPSCYGLGFCFTKLGRECSAAPNTSIYMGRCLHRTPQSDHHSLLFFFNRQSFSDQFASDITKGTHDLVCFNDSNDIREVKIVGYHRWVFKEDLQQLNSTMLHSRNSSLLKRKFLTIDDDQPHP